MYVYVLFDCPKDTHRIYCGVFDSKQKAIGAMNLLKEEEKRLGITGSDYVIRRVPINSVGLEDSEVVEVEA